EGVSSSEMYLPQCGHCSDSSWMGALQCGQGTVSSSSSSSGTYSSSSSPSQSSSGSSSHSSSVATRPGKPISARLLLSLARRLRRPGGRGDAIQLRDQLLRGDESVALVNPLAQAIDGNLVLRPKLPRDPTTLAEPVARGRCVWEEQCQAARERQFGGHGQELV